MKRFAFLLLIPGYLIAQGRAPFLAVPRFEGVVTYTLNQSGKLPSGGRYSVVASARATFLLERVSRITPTWRGLLTSSSSKISFSGVDYTACELKEEYELEGPLRFSGSPSSWDADLSLSTNYWNFNLLKSFGPRAAAIMRPVCPNGPGVPFNITQQLSVPTLPQTMSFPTSGLTLASSGKVSDQGHFGYVKIDEVTWDYTLSIRPEGGEYRLELSSEDYAKWRPSANAKGRREGKELKITATLVNSDGRPAPDDVVRFEWELLKTSQEPGIAINWPQESKDKDFDLLLWPEPGQVETDVSLQKMVRPVRNTASDTATILPTDWGGWSTLRVVAVLRDDKRIVGRWKGANEDDLRIPKRRSNSYIADVFREESGADGDDLADDETLAGSSGKGDGLSLYEEYRGFYEAGEHVTGKPDRQEYFAVNDLKSDGEAGLAVFGGLSGLLVRVLEREELSSTRVINANRDQGPHRVDQHGVYFEYADLSKNGAGNDIGKAVGGPGTPKDVEKVLLAEEIMPREVPAGIANISVATIAHEAMHSVNVYHHGRGDKRVRWFVEDGVVKERVGLIASPITIQDESNNDVTETYKQSLGAGGSNYNIGVNEGQHSGDDTCIMRYDIARAYIDNGNSSVRRVFGGIEAVGGALCVRKTGSGVNASDHLPQSRYSDAKNGDCRSQILLNDAIAAPRR
jgi:hypothetical protein